MEQLQEMLKKVLADTFVMYMKAHGYHWNIIGPDFLQLHGFFDSLYNELWGAIDPIAEHIRTLDAFSQGTIARMKELSTVPEDETIPTAPRMLANLLQANDIVLASLKEAYMMANQLGEDGLSNFLQDRIDTHRKHGWMIKATLGK